VKPPRKPQCATLPRFPTRPQNRPSLPHIGYRIGTYSDARLAMLYALDRDLTLAPWTHRQPDDPGIALLESTAIVTDILTFYQELYANEAFLRTATWRESVADLVRLTGYRLAPAIGGNATFSLQVRGNNAVQVPSGFAIKADLADVPDTATFETSQTVTARPAFNSFNLFAPLDGQSCAPGTTALRAPATVTLKSGDKLLLGDASASGGSATIDVSEIVVVDQVRQYHGETLFTVKGGLRRRNWTGDHPTSSVTAYRLGRTFKHFGHNAPPQEIVTNSGSPSNGVTAHTTEYRRPYTDFTKDNFPNDTTVQPLLGPTQFPFDAPVDDLPVRSRLIMRSEFHIVFPLFNVDWIFSWTFARSVTASMKAGVRWGGLTGSSSLISIDSALDPTGYDWANNIAVIFLSFFLEPDVFGIDVRKIEIYEILDEFTVHAQGTATATASGKNVFFFGLPADAAALQNQQLAFTKPGADTYYRTVVSVPDLSSADPATPLMVQITLDDVVTYADFDNNTPAVTVYGNLVDATEGKTQPSTVLGSGDARATWQTFRVPKSPLTYLVQAGATPPQQPELHVFVGDIEWIRVAALFPYGPNDQVYVVRQDAAGDSWVQFGDGVTGSRLPSGVDNVSAVWRVGAGSFGPMKPDTDPSLGARLDALKGVKLPALVTGGAPAETGDHAQKAAPGRLQSLDRLVSIDDFAAEALGIGGVVRARADWELIGGVPGIVVTILMAAGRDGEADAVRTTLAHFNRCRGPHRVPLVVRQAEFEYVYVDATVSLDPRRKQDAVLLAIKQALGVNGEEADGVDGTGGLFDLAGRELGENEYVTRIEGIIQDVPGVVWTSVTAFGSLGLASDPTKLVLPPEPRALADKLHANPDRLFRLFSKAASDPNANALNLLVAASPPGECHG
jgi:hypothetical protein